MNPNIPQTDRKRVVIVGAGFGGLQLARKLSSRKEFQVVLINKTNYHEFQPLYYQVATAGLEASSILFPLRAVFQDCKDVHIRVTTVTQIHTDTKTVDTDLGPIEYDYLVIATGTDSNFFGMQNIIEKALPMKSVSEAIALRNRLLQNFEDALSVDNEDEKQGFMNVVVVGGGPTGVELCGTFAELKNTILPGDYPELDFQMMQIYLIESGAELLGPFSKPAQEKAKKYLEKSSVNIRLSTRVLDFDGRYVSMNDGTKLRTNNLIWTAGVKANMLNGFPKEVIGRGGRYIVNRYNQIQGYQDVFAVGDVALMTEEKFPDGHPQVAQPAIQQGKWLGRNLIRLQKNEPMQEFHYKDLGTMATIGKGVAVADLPFGRFQGFFAWLLWLFVHLMAIVGVKNRMFIFINWMWNYLSDDQSLRLIIKPKIPKGNFEAIKQKVEDQLVTK